MAFLAGVKAQPVDIYKFFGDAGVDGFNLVASIASFVLAIGVLLELGNAAYSYRNGVRVGHDPWRGATLEWFALSPPPEHNFDAVPDVRSAEPLHDIRRAIRRPDRELATAPAARSPVAASSRARGGRGSQAESGGDGPSGGAPVA